MKAPRPPSHASAILEGVAAAVLAVTLALVIGDWGRARTRGGTWLTGAARAETTASTASTTDDDLLESTPFPWNEDDQELRPGTWGASPRDPGLHLESNRIAGAVAGPVATLHIHRVYRYEETRWPQNPGAHASDDLVVPHLTALHDFWITEHGVRIPAVVREKAEARADFEATVGYARDPGLLEWRGQGRVRFELFPVLKEGTPKHASWRQDSILEPDATGRVRLPLPLHGIRTRELEIDLEVHEPRGVSRWHLPAGLRAVPTSASRWRIYGRFRNMSRTPQTLVPSWTLTAAPGPVAKPSQVLRIDGGGYLAQTMISGIARHPLPLTILGQDAAAPSQVGALRSDVGGAPVRLVNTDLPPLRLPAGTLDRLAGVTRLLAAHYDHTRGSRAERARVVAAMSRDLRVVSPVASLYAKPGLTEDATPRPDERALPRPPGEGPAGRSPRRGTTPTVRFGSSIVPNFQAARRRANGRACFANQKTIAGAIEMYNLDFNRDLIQDWPGANRVGGTHVLGGLLRPAPGVLAVGAHSYEFWTRRHGPPTRWIHTRDMAQELEGQGYLQQYPRDPGTRDDDAYLLLEVSPGEGHGASLFCRHHGFIQPPGGPGQPPREQLRDSGVTDADLLELASPEMVSSTRRSVYLTHLGELEFLALWILGSLIWSLGANAPGRRRGLLRFLAFLGAAFFGTLLFQVPDAAPVVRWSLSGGIVGMVLYVVGLSLYGIVSASPVELLYPQLANGTGAPPWADHDEGVRRRLRASVVRNQEYFASLGWIYGGLLVMATAGLLITSDSIHSAPASVILWSGLAALVAGLVLGLEVGLETLRWIEKHEGEAFWSRHMLRGIGLCFLTGGLLLASTATPASAFFGLLLTCLMLAPRYMLGASFLGQYHEEVLYEDYRKIRGRR